MINLNNKEILKKQIRCAAYEKPIEEIGQFYFENEEIFKNQGKFRAAIEYKNIKVLFDTKNFLPLGLPDHALIGIKDNAGPMRSPGKSRRICSMKRSQFAR